MKGFTKVLNAYREWILSISVLKAIQPYAIYILFISLGISFLQEIFWSVFEIYNSFFNLLGQFAHFGFYLGLALIVTTKDIKLTHFALFIQAFLIFFPFKLFTVYTVLNGALYIFLGIQFYRYIASQLNAAPPVIEKNSDV